ncbi:MAG: hypothetical protein AB1758_23235, partial [Candidatus Eremiobacterota bacterium]
MPYLSVRRSLCILLALLSVFLSGCGEDGFLLVGPPAAPAPIQGPTTRVILVRHVLQKAVPVSATHFRFTGLDTGGAVVYGPDTQVKAAEIPLVVPLSLTTLVIEYLEGGVVIGIGTHPIPEGAFTYIL